MKKRKSLLLATVFSFALTPLAMANEKDSFKNIQKSRELIDNGNYTEAFKLEERFCNDGDAKACTRLADMYFNGKGVTQNSSKAVELLNKTCHKTYFGAYEDYSLDACYDLALRYAKGSGVKQNATKSENFLRISCSKKHHFACMELKSLASYKFEQNKYSEALYLYETICKVGHADACLMSGAMYADGTGVRQNAIKAAKLFKDGCNRAYDNYRAHDNYKYNTNQSDIDELDELINQRFALFGKNCTMLGNSYSQGFGVRQNFSTAKEYFGKACDLGDQDGCNAYKKLNIQGY